MMKFAMFCMCVFLSLGLVSGLCALLDDFGDGNDDGWEQIQGDWSVDSGEYVQGDVEWTTTATHETYHRSYFGDEDWTDDTFEAKVRIEEGGDLAPIVGIFFRVTEKTPIGDYYYFRLDERPSEGPGLIKAPNNIIQINNGQPAEIGQDYILKVEVEGDSIKCYVDGELEIEVFDGSFQQGAVGVGTFNAVGHFDDVSVNGEGIATNPVEAEGKLTTTWASIKSK
jgi:hypothetical protein